MKMKKIVVMLLVLTLMLTMTACVGSGPKTAQAAYDIYSRAAEAMSNIESLAANTNMTMSMSYEGEEIKIELAGFIKEVILSETEVEMQLEMNTSTMGQDMEIKAFYKDGIYYMESLGQKVSMEMPLDQMLEQANTKALSFPDTAIKSQRATEKDGGQELSFTLDGTVLTDAIAGQLGNLSAMLGEQPDMTLSDIEYMVFIDGKSSLKTTWMSFSMEMGMMGETIPVSAEISMEYVQINNVSIDFPADLDSYPLIDMAYY
jgi:hypothetical protein